MGELKLASGQAVKELRVRDGLKWVAKTGKIWDGARWINFIRPKVTFKDNHVTYSGLTRQDNTGKIEDNKLLFNTLISYDVYNPLTPRLTIREGLTMWFDAQFIVASNGDKISICKDKSGNGLDAVQDNPTLRPMYLSKGINGLPAIKHSGKPNELLYTIPLTMQERTYFIVVKKDGNPPPTSLPYHSLILQDAQPYYQIYSDSLDNYTVELGGNANSKFEVTPHLLSTTLSSNSMSFYKNGKLSKTTNSLNLARITAPFNIGGYVAYSANASFGEYLIYNRILTNEERQSVESYLFAKWGIQEEG